MYLQILKSKICHATISEANLHYEGSITVPQDLMQAAGLFAGEKVHVLNVNNGQRFETYIITGPAGSGRFCLNGPAARLGVAGDKVMVLSYALMEPEEARRFSPVILHLDERNAVKS